MDKTFTLPEIQALYQFLEVQETSEGFLITPPSPRQGREKLLIPKTLSVSLPDYRPFDPTAAWFDDIVADILEAFNITNYTELFSTYCRFGNFDNRQKILRISNPIKASHIQILGIREADGAGFMFHPHPAEEQLETIAEDYYKTLIHETGEMIRGWILKTDFRTQPIQKECSRILTNAKAKLRLD